MNHLSPTAPDPAPRLPPAPLSQFIGREREVAAVGRLLETTRLLTLTGAGGSGKTRLAREVAGRIEAAGGAVLWADLSAVADPAKVMVPVTEVFGMVEQAAGTALALVEQEIGEARLVLVLDSCEHLVDAVAGVTEQLLRACPGLTILATSREALGVPAETAWLVPPLSDEEAVELFVARGRSVLPSFAATEANAATIRDICRRLDGIPLAIELAAARVRVLSVDQIAERLGNALRLLSAGSRTAIPRHRTIRGTLDWSYDLLSDREQILLRRLAIFYGGFTIEAAEGVTSAEPLDSLEVLDLLAALVDKSLVVLDTPAGNPRYRLLETVRQYGLERLAEANETESIRRRHAEFFLAVAEAAEPFIFGGIRDALWIGRLVPEIPNFAATAEWAMQADDRVEAGLRLSWALHWLWWSRGPFEEALRLSTLLDRADQVPRLVRIRAMLAFAHLNVWQGKLDASIAHSNRALALLESEADPELVAYALTLRGAVLTITGQVAAALLDLSRAIPLAREHSATVLPGIALHFQGICLQASGDVDGAEACFRAEVSICRSVDHLPGAGHGLTGLGVLLHSLDRFDEALGAFREGLVLHRAVADGWGIAKGLEGVAAVLARRDPERATRLLGAAQAHRERIAHALWEPERMFLEPVIAGLKLALGAGWDAAWAAGRATGRDPAIELALERTEAVPAPVADAAPTPPPRPPQGATPDLAVDTLGGLTVRRQGDPVEPAAWGSARARELLVYLLTHPRGVSKDQVGQVLWPDATPAQLRNAFHVTLHRLRRALGHAEWVEVDGERYRLAPGLRIEFDAARFETEVPAAMAALARGETAAPARLEAALAAYRGPFLEGESFGDWSLEMRDRLERFFVEGGVALARWLLDQKRHPDADRLAARILARDELNETAWRIRMTALARAGERPQAIRLFQQLTQLVARELDTEPDEETRELYEAIQDGKSV